MKKLRCTMFISESDKGIVPPLSQFDVFGDTVDELFDELYDLSLSLAARKNIAKIIGTHFDYYYPESTERV